MERRRTSGTDTAPLSIDCAQRYTPQVRAELSQLWNVVSHLHKDKKHVSELKNDDAHAKINTRVGLALTCPPSCRCALSYIVSIWWTNFSKSGMINFFLKALVSSMMLLPTHLRKDTITMRSRNP